MEVTVLYPPKDNQIHVSGEKITILGIMAEQERQMDDHFEDAFHRMNVEGILEDFRNNPIDPLPLLPLPLPGLLDDDEEFLNSITIEVDDSDDAGLLREPINEANLLEAIRRNPSNKPELVPDAIHLSEPIKDLGFYTIPVEKDGKSYEQKLWILPTDNSSP